MNLEELRSVQDAERTRSDLQPLRESFYEEAGEYIASLKADRDRAAAEADDPFSSAEVRRLTDEIETAEEVVEAVYERRLGKLVERASLAASDVTVDEDGLTSEEQALFHDLVERMETSKRTVLETLDPEVDTASRADPPERGADADRADASAEQSEEDAGGDAAPTGATRTGRRDPDGVSAADLMGPGNETTTDGGTTTRDRRADDPREGADTGPARRADTPGDAGRTNGTDGRDEGSDATERVTVRITSDVGEILGVDARQYDLTAEDIVQLPARNADPLLERGAAERLD